MERRSASRASVACAPCRSQHLKCDAIRPSCSRCQTLSKTCSYPESRRTGKSRAASTRRTRAQDSQFGSNMLTPARTTTPSIGVIESISDVNMAIMPQADACECSGTMLLDLYYQYFHHSHPFVLPRKAIEAMLISEPSTVRPLVEVMQHIGSFYKDSPTLKKDVLDIENSEVIDGFSVQTNLLKALAKSMCAEQAAADELLTEAIEQAKTIGMNTKDFADSTEWYDPVLAESWRRTWWMLYLVDAQFSVVRRDLAPVLQDTASDVDLPCEDQDYNCMHIPSDRIALSAYQNREFALEERLFSSFAYFIDATDIFVSSLRASFGYESLCNAKSLCENLETTIAGWFVMLPSNKRELLINPVVLDQLLFQAHMMLYTALAYIHRPLSTLRYDPAEGISSCGSPPPPLSLLSDLNMGTTLNRRTHLEKLFRAVRKQNQCLVAVPADSVQMSPFVICMIACCTIAHLVACKSEFTLEEACAARSRIRLCLGTLMHYEEIWPRAKKILRELKSIACIMLQVETSSQARQPYNEDIAGQEPDLVDLFDKELHQIVENSL
ncbi:hypothetical protein BGZ63DRAFT_386745 [Mariannaea sp. PMI_226]|nr:hypothetical protein BGZ63DRAFT_386745 [Mariannaea sp. PMI_226]